MLRVAGLLCPLSLCLCVQSCFSGHRREELLEDVFVHHLVLRGQRSVDTQVWPIYLVLNALQYLVELVFFFAKCLLKLYIWFINAFPICKLCYVWGWVSRLFVECTKFSKNRDNSNCLFLSWKIFQFSENVLTFCNSLVYFARKYALKLFLVEVWFYQTDQGP